MWKIRSDEAMEFNNSIRLQFWIDIGISQAVLSILYNLDVLKKHIHLFHVTV